MANHIIHVLLVEDNPADAQLIAELLANAKGMSFELESAGSLAEATVRVASGGIDLVLLDLGLPDCVGLETLRRVRGAASEAVVVVVLSGLADEETAVRAVQEGAQDYLVKGHVDGNMLIRSIRYALGRGQAQEALRRAQTELENRVRERTAELMKANEALRDSQHLLQGILDHSSNIIFVKDSECRYILVNRAFEKLLQTDQRSIAGKRLSDLVPNYSKEFLEHVRKTDQQVLDTGVPMEMEESVMLDSGPRTFLVLKAPLFDGQGKPYAVCGISTDVTEWKRLQEESRHSQRMEAVGRLAGGVAHDFNNLLSVIIGYGEMLRSGLRGNPALLDQLEHIIKAADQASTLTRKLLTFSRRGAGNVKVLDLNAALRDLENMLRSVVGEHIEMELQLSAKPCLVRADPGQLEQAILNLVFNARDAMPGGGKLILEVAAVEVDEELAKPNKPLQPGPYVRLRVRDTGCGMSAETQAHIFEPFFTTKESGKGTGLGLATVYGTVRQAGGAILVESEPGKGACFQIYFPRMEGTPSRPSRVVPAGPTRGTETILVVEDEDGIRSLIAEVLQRNGYTVLEASQGREALELVESRQGSIDLVVTDLVMPQMGGRELAEAIVASHPDIKVLYISGYPDRASAQGKASPPGSALMEKPFAPEALVRKVRKMLDAPPRRLRSQNA